MTVELKIADAKIAQWLLSDPVHPSYSEKQKFMRVHYGSTVALWMLVRGCYERT